MATLEMEGLSWVRCEAHEMCHGWGVGDAAGTAKDRRITEENAQDVDTGNPLGD